MTRTEIFKIGGKIIRKNEREIDNPPLKMGLGSQVLYDIFVLIIYFLLNTLYFSFQLFHQFWKVWCLSWSRFAGSIRHICFNHIFSPHDFVLFILTLPYAARLTSWHFGDWKWFSTFQPERQYKKTSGT